MIEVQTLNMLSEIETGETVVITKVLGYGAFRKRITEMGFVKGKVVKVIKNAPLQDPVEYEIMGYNVSLRRSEARLIEVIPLIDYDFTEHIKFEGAFSSVSDKERVREKANSINVALVGNPNCGKTTLFNYASGSHERVGNYGGVTVNSKEARLTQDGYTLNIVDLPGTYSISEYTPEELYVRTHIAENLPDVVVNVINASNLERNLFLTTQLIDMNIKVVIALNMHDELEQKGTILKYKELAVMLGIPIVPTIAVRGKGISDLMKTIINVYEDKDPTLRHIHINYGSNIESSISKIQAEINQNTDITDRFSSRYLAIKLLENDKSTKAKLHSCENYFQIVNTCNAEIKSLSVNTKSLQKR
jgi:ferrous iron transport protein B